MNGATEPGTLDPVDYETREALAQAAPPGTPFGYFVDGQYIPAVSGVGKQGVGGNLAALCLDADGCPKLTDDGQVTYQRYQGRVTCWPRPYDCAEPRTGEAQAGDTQPQEAPATRERWDAAEQQADATGDPSAEIAAASSTDQAEVDSFASLATAIRGGEAKFLYSPTNVIPGLLCLSAILPEFGMPLGFIWFRWEPGQRLAIAHIWVAEHVRRCGLANQMLYALGRWYPSARSIVTGMGNALSTPWMEQAGFVRDPNGWLWTKDLPAGGAPADL